MPFEHSSGKFRGKDRVSQMADKYLKSLLHMCAVASIKHQGELKDYYHWCRRMVDGKFDGDIKAALQKIMRERISNESKVVTRKTTITRSMKNIDINNPKDFDELVKQIQDSPIDDSCIITVSEEIKGLPPSDNLIRFALKHLEEWEGK